MAEGGGDLFSLSVQKLDEELTCPVCHEHFEEPKVLPCLHCYCKKCVAALISRTPRGQPFNCPECRRNVQVVGNDPESLPTAFFVNRMEAVFSVMKKAEKKEEVKCESCSRQSSIAFCKNCRHYICDRCTESHKLMSVFSNHEVVSISSLLTHFKKSGSSRAPIEAHELKCHKHTNELLKLYCYTCHQLVCRDCTLVDHKEHKYAFIVDAIPRCKSTIKAKVESLQNLSCGLKMASKLLTESEKKLQDHNVATIKAIDDAHNRIVLKLQQKSKELKAASVKMINSSQEEIASQKKNIDLAVGEVDSLYDFLSRNLERATDQELFSLLKQMSDQAERAAHLYADPPAKFPVPTPPQLEVHCSNHVLQVLQKEFSVSKKGNPPSVTVVHLSSLGSDVDVGDLNIYFEGVVPDVKVSSTVKLDGGRAQLKLEGLTDESIELLKARQHKIRGKPVTFEFESSINVKDDQGPPLLKPDGEEEGPKTLKVCKVPDVSEEVLKAFFEGKKSGSCSGAVESVAKISPGVFHVTFHDPKVAAQVLSEPRTFKKVSLELSILEAVDTPDHSESGVCNQIEVSNVPDTVKEVVLKAYFETFKSGGSANAVSECKKVSSGVFHVTFHNPQVAAQVMENDSHIFKKAALQLKFVCREKEDKQRYKLNQLAIHGQISMQN